MGHHTVRQCAFHVRLGRLPGDSHSCGDTYFFIVDPDRAEIAPHGLSGRGAKQAHYKTPPACHHFLGKCRTGDSFSTYLLGYNMDGSYGEWLARWANQRPLGQLVDLHMNPPSSIVEREERGRRASILKFTTRAVSEYLVVVCFLLSFV